MSTLEKTDLNIGFIPLLDCIALLWAKHQGYFAEQGLNVTLVKEPSWASLRDRLAFGFLDAAHCLSAIIPATTIAEDHLGIQLQTPLILTNNTAFISLNQALCHQLDISLQDAPESSAQKIVNALKEGTKIQFAHVFKQSIHHYILREWLALADEDFARNYHLSALPPPYMVEAIANHLIDGFCVGEPWNTQAEIQGYSHIIASSQDIVPKIPDKVLAVTQDWAQQHPNSLAALVTAIQKAQDDLKNLKEFDQVWTLLEEYRIIQFNCSAEIHVNAYYKIQNIIRNFVDNAIPQSTDFKWIITHMCKWDKIDIDDQNVDKISDDCIVNFETPNN